MTTRRPKVSRIAMTTSLSVAFVAAGMGTTALSSAAALSPSSTYSFGNGLLGNGNTGSSSTPQVVTGLQGKLVIAVSSYSENGVAPDHTLALTNGGTVYAWGKNNHGQLGVPGGNQTTPQAVSLANSPHDSRIIAVAAGYQYSLALTAKGQVLTWGKADMLGDGSTADRSTPKVINLGPGDFGSAIAAGQTHAEVVTSSGQVTGWGSNSDGELGNGSAVGVLTPSDARISVSCHATSAAVGGTVVKNGVGPVNFSLALCADGRVFGWGANNYGQLGQGTEGPDELVPVQVAIPAGVTLYGIAAGGQNGGAYTSDGRLLMWGQNTFGNLGDGTTHRRDTPQYVAMPTGSTSVVRLSMSDYTTLVSTETHQVYGWGSNESWSTGALATTAVTQSNVPIAIDVPSADRYVELDAGGPTSYVVLQVP